MVKSLDLCFSSELLNLVGGYDVIGRDELRSKILGTNKWIGTAGTILYFNHGNLN
jgi:hypothetical protein